jgi:Ca2+:H+ antiporter
MSPTPSESTRLLENGSGNGEYTEPNKPFAQRAVALFIAEGEPSWADSYKYFWFGAWLNILLIFVPLSFIAHHLNWDAALRFAFSFIAIMPLAKVCLSQTF